MRILVGCGAVMWGVSGLALLVLFESWRGRGLGLWVLLALGAALALLQGIALARWLVLAWSVLGLTLWWVSPAALVRAEGASGRNWPPADPLNLVPEADLVRAGVKLLFPAVKGNVILPLLNQLYGEMDGESGYTAMRHVVFYTGADLAGGPTAAGHYYCYLPPGVEKPPLLVFFHGALGNYQCFLYFWQKWAAARGWAVICPTFGYGNWYRPGGGEAAERAFLDALKTLPVDSSRVLVTGLSNGGTAVVRLVERQGAHVQGVALYSPVLEVERYGSAEFRAWAQEHPPVVVLEGDRDTVVHPQTVQKRLAELRKLGVNSEFQLLSGHDHYMMFSAAQEVYASLDRLVAKCWPR